MADISRMDDMINRYGELCNQQAAAHILGVSARTIARMMQDGRLKRSGHRVDVRSICDYIENGDRMEIELRYRRRYGVRPGQTIDFFSASKHRGIR